MKKKTTILTQFNKFLTIMSLLSATATPGFTASDSDVRPVDIVEIKSYTNKERNALKRVVAHAGKDVSPLTYSSNVGTQAYRLDLALSEWHTLQELNDLPMLSDCTPGRINSHISHLGKHFKNTLRKEVNGMKFRFVRI
jgi:hypothetical protein